MKASRRIHGAPLLIARSRTRCPIQNPWNGDCRVSPNLIGLRLHLFEHVEIVLMAGLSHALEYADIPTWDVRHAHTDQRFKSIRTHQRCVPRMTCTPVMAHDDSAGYPQRIEQPN